MIQDFNKIHEIIETFVQANPISHWGASRLEMPLTIETYKDWLKQSYHGEMNYLQTHLPIKENPALKWPDLQSAMVFAFPYVPHPKPSELIPSELKIAGYAKGEDYHFWINETLQQLCQILQNFDPSAKFVTVTDSGPILERDLALRAGLGWIGKNTCLIHPKKGSLFLVGEILTSLSLKYETSQIKDFCGKCTACMDACPTQAITAPRVLDARKCISYLTIESKTIPPPELREKITDWFFGCDICQTVCPWNSKPLKAVVVESSRAPNRQREIETLREILRLSGKQLQKKFNGTALHRAGAFGLRRNALILARNKGFQELKPEINKFTSDPRLGDLARWVLHKLEEAKI